MTLPETYLLSSDLSLITGRYLNKLDIKQNYPNYNGATKSVVFPTSTQSWMPFSPIVDKIGRWGRHILLQLNTSTIVFRMGYKVEIKIIDNYTTLSGIDSNLIAILNLSEAPKSSDCKYLCYYDPLVCGSISVYASNEIPDEFSYLGMDIMDLSFTPSYLLSELLRFKLGDKLVTIKSFLMNKRIIAWLDNPIVDEALFISEVNPMQNIATISKDTIGVIVKSLKVVYRRAIELIRNDYQRTEKVPLDIIYSIYKRDDSKCVICDTIIKKTISDGMRTYWCPHCQPLSLENIRNE